MTWKNLADAKSLGPLSGDSLSDTLELGAASLLSLEAMLAEISALGTEPEAQDDLRNAIGLVRSAVERIGGGADGRPSRQLAKGFVTRSRRP